MNLGVKLSHKDFSEKSIRDSFWSSLVSQTVDRDPPGGRQPSAWGRERLSRFVVIGTRPVKNMLATNLCLRFMLDNCFFFKFTFFTSVL